MTDRQVRFKITYRCNCGDVHFRFEDWANCSMALVPQPNKPWWRDDAGESPNNSKED